VVHFSRKRAYGYRGVVSTKHDPPVRMWQAADGERTYATRHRRPGTHPVIHGYYWTDLEEAARIAVQSTRHRAGDRVDARDDAMSQICEALSQIPADPDQPWPLSRNDLVWSGMRGISRAVSQDMKHRGTPTDKMDRHTTDRGGWLIDAARPRTLMFWAEVAPLSVSSHESGIVDRMAVATIVESLPQPLRATADLLMAGYDATQTAAHLGVGRSTVYRHMRKIRTIFDELFLGGVVTRRERPRSAADATHCAWGHPMPDDHRCRKCLNRHQLRHARKRRSQGATL
jgi:hypothetical protein